jgi:hypothetical protein
MKHGQNACVTFHSDVLVEYCLLADRELVLTERIDRFMAAFWRLKWLSWYSGPMFFTFSLVT